MKQLIKEIVVHCKPVVLDTQPIKDGYLSWNYSPRFGADEIDITIIDDQDLDDEEFCEFYDIDYDHVNCIELVDVI